MRPGVITEGSLEPGSIFTVDKSRKFWAWLIRGDQYKMQIMVVRVDVEDKIWRLML